jgi:hypothetical protein
MWIVTNNDTINTNATKDEITSNYQALKVFQIKLKLESGCFLLKSKL